MKMIFSAMVAAVSLAACAPTAQGPMGYPGPPPVAGPPPQGGGGGGPPQRAIVGYTAPAPCTAGVYIVPFRRTQNMRLADFQALQHYLWRTAACNERGIPRPAFLDNTTVVSGWDFGDTPPRAGSFTWDGVRIEWRVLPPQD